MDDIWIWIIVAIVVILVIALVTMMLNKRKTEHHRERATELRSEASTRTDSVRESELRAREKQAEAERARVEAERKEREAAHASQGLDQERALQEDRVREADQIDPDVDHRADDYEPRLEGLDRSEDASESTATRDTTDSTRVEHPDAPGSHRGTGV